MGRVLVPLHLKGVLLDVVDGWKDHSLPVLLDSGQNRLGPETQGRRSKISLLRQAHPSTGTDRHTTGNEQKRPSWGGGPWVGWGSGGN